MENPSSGAIGKGGPLFERAPEGTDAESGPTPAPPTPRGGVPIGRFQVMTSMGAPGAPARTQSAPERQVGAARSGGGGVPARMQMLGAIARAPAGEHRAMRAGQFESAGHRMWSALGEPGAEVDPEKARQVLPPQVFRLYERLRAAGERPTVSQLEERWLAEAQAVEIRGPELDRLVEYAERAAAAEVAGLLGTTDPSAPVDPARLSGDVLATFERLRASGAAPTAGALGRARAAEAASAIRAAAGDDKLSKKEARKLPEGFQAIVRTYLLEGRGPVAIHQSAGEVADDIRKQIGDDAAKRVLAASSANPDGVLSKKERRRLEASERDATLGRWLDGGGREQGADGLVRYLSTSVTNRLRRALGDREDAPLDDETARRALPPEFYGKYRELAVASGGAPPTGRALRETLLRDAERDARAACADGVVSPSDRERLARYVDSATVDALESGVKEERADEKREAEEWRDTVDETWWSSFWSFFSTILGTVAADQRRATETHRRDEDLAQDVKKQRVKQDLLRADDRRKADVAAIVRRLAARAKDRPVALADGTLVRLDRRPPLDFEGLPKSGTAFLVVVRGREAAVATAPDAPGGPTAIGSFTARDGRPPLRFDPRKDDPGNERAARMLEDADARMRGAGGG